MTTIADRVTLMKEEKLFFIEPLSVSYEVVAVIE
jgi:hypothetical protein